MVGEQQVEAVGPPLGDPPGELRACSTAAGVVGGSPGPRFSEGPGATPPASSAVTGVPPSGPGARVARASRVVGVDEVFDELGVSRALPATPSTRWPRDSSSAAPPPRRRRRGGVARDARRLDRSRCAKKRAGVGAELVGVGPLRRRHRVGSPGMAPCTASGQVAVSPDAAGDGQAGDKPPSSPRLGAEQWRPATASARQAALAGGDADWAATVASVADGHHAGGDRQPAPLDPPVERLRCPTGCGSAQVSGSVARHQAQFGGVGTDRRSVQRPELGGEVGVVARAPVVVAEELRPAVVGSPAL